MKAPHVVLLLATLTTCFLTTNALKCHECYPDEFDTDTCTRFDFGVVEDNCTYCYAEELINKQVKRYCMEEDHNMFCNIDDRKLQTCFCNHMDLCNGIFKPAVKCYMCDTDEGGCSPQQLGTVGHSCLACQSVQVNENRFVRGCMKGTDVDDYAGCRIIKDQHTCICNTDLCNARHVLSRGQQETVSGRVLIGGAVAAMLVLAQLF